MKTCKILKKLRLEKVIGNSYNMNGILTQIMPKVKSSFMSCN